MRSLLIGVGVFLAVWLLSARSAAAQRDPFEDDPRGTPGHPETGGRTSTADVIRRIQERHYSLDWEYIVAFDLGYSLTLDGRFAGHCATRWDPAHGLQLSFDRSPARADCTVDELKMMLQTLWYRSLLLSVPEKDLTSVATGEGIELRRKDDQGQETWKVGVDGTVLQIEYQGRELGEMRWTPKYHEREGKLYVESLTFAWGPPGAGRRTVEYVPGYTVRDGVVLLKSLKVTRRLGEGQAGGEWSLSLDESKVMKIENTGRGLQKDRVEAYLAVTAMGDLRSEDAQKRVDACKLLERVGAPHARPALPILKQLAERDPSDAVRQAASAAVARIDGRAGSVADDRTSRVPSRPRTDGRIVGTWVGGFDLFGIPHEEHISFTAEGRVHSIRYNLQVARIVFNAEGTYTLEDGVLTVRYAGRPPGMSAVQFEGNDEMVVEVAQGVQVRYRRKP